MRTDVQTFQIGEVAAETALSRDTLRFYERGDAARSGDVEWHESRPMTGDDEPVEATTTTPEPLISGWTRAGHLWPAAGVRCASP